MPTSQTEYLSLFPLFIFSFLSEILIPIPIGVILLAMILAGFAIGPVVVVSMLGFTLGAIVDYSVGRYGMHRWDWFKRHENSKTLTKTKDFYGRHGQWTLLGAWVPAFGKYIAPVAGMMQVPWKKFLPLYIIGKILYFIPFILVLIILGLF